jgi:hypothetical protein
MTGPAVVRVWGVFREDQDEAVLVCLTEDEARAAAAQLPGGEIGEEDAARMPGGYYPVKSVPPGYWREVKEEWRAFMAEMGAAAGEEEQDQEDPASRKFKPVAFVAVPGGFCPVCMARTPERMNGIITGRFEYTAWAWPHSGHG